MSSTIVDTPSSRQQITALAKHWIDGKWVDSKHHNDSINPATGDVIGQYADGGRKEADMAVEAALRAFAETE